jgi:mRNA-degrading endonuclease toxin of MazEF toxin-antitoxin module
MTRRGDVVIVEIPFTEINGARKRPRIVVQSDAYNASIRKTIIAICTGNLKRINDPSYLYIDPRMPDGASSCLSGQSLVSCYNLFTVEQTRIEQVIDHLSDILIRRLNACLKNALDLN